MSDKKKYPLYSDCKEYVKNKDTAVESVFSYTLAMTAQMFEYEGLPDSIPKRELERMLQMNGDVFITEDKGTLYAFTGGLGGERDEYYRPTLYTVANPYLNLSKSYRIGEEGIRVLNDSEGVGLRPVIGKYAALLTDANLTLDTTVVLARIAMLISAPDDKSKASADAFVSKIIDGDFSVIGDSAFFDGVKMQGVNDTTQRIQQVTEVVQFLKASLMNELGIDAATNLKRERMTTAETQQETAVLVPFVYDMLKCRQLYFDQVNDMFGTDIHVEFSSIWAGDDGRGDDGSGSDESDFGGDGDAGISGDSLSSSGVGSDGGSGSDPTEPTVDAGDSGDSGDDSEQSVEPIGDSATDDDDSATDDDDSATDDDDSATDDDDKKKGDDR